MSMPLPGQECFEHWEGKRVVSQNLPKNGGCWQGSAKVMHWSNVDHKQPLLVTFPSSRLENFPLTESIPSHHKRKEKKPEQTPKEKQAPQPMHTLKGNGWLCQGQNAALAVSLEERFLSAPSKSCFLLKRGILSFNPLFHHVEKFKSHKTIQNDQIQSGLNWV